MVLGSPGLALHLVCSPCRAPNVFVYYPFFRFAKYFFFCLCQVLTRLLTPFTGAALGFSVVDR